MLEHDPENSRTSTHREAEPESLVQILFECWGDVSPTPLGRYIKQEWSTVKKAPGIICVAIGLSGAIGYWVTAKVDSSTIGDLSEQVKTLTREKDTALTNLRISDNALAPWKTLANSQFPEKPINERMNLLFANMQEQIKQLANQIDRAVPPPKSLKERLRICLDSIDTRIMEALQTQPVSFEGKVDFRKVEALKILSEEQEASEYITIISISEADGVSFSGTRMGGTDIVKFFVTRKLIEP